MKERFNIQLIDDIFPAVKKETDIEVYKKIVTKNNLKSVTQLQKFIKDHPTKIPDNLYLSLSGQHLLLEELRKFFGIPKMLRLSKAEKLFITTEYSKGNPVKNIANTINRDISVIYTHTKNTGIFKKQIVKSNNLKDYVEYKNKHKIKTSWEWRKHAYEMGDKFPEHLHKRLGNLKSLKISQIFNRAGNPRVTFTNTETIDIIKRYKNGESARKIIKSYPIKTCKPIYKLLHNNGISTSRKVKL